MAEYFYTALNSTGKEVWGSVKASDAAQAVIVAEARGLRSVKLRTTQPGMGSPDMFSRLRGVSTQELAVTSRQLAVMLAAGIGIPQALSMICRQPLGYLLGKAWKDVLEDVQNGSYLSQAMTKHRTVFGNLYIGMTKAGEASGTLTENLKRIADYLENEYGLQNRVKAALTYPVTVFVISLLLAVFIVQHILPKFLNGLFQETGTELPAVTKVLIAVTSFFNNPVAMGWCLIGLVLGIWMLVRHLRTRAGKQQLERFALSLPGLRTVTAKVLTCRVARTMAALLKSGLLAVQALELTADVVDNYILSDYLKTAVQDLKDGHAMDAAMRAIPIFPAIFPAFVSLGEESGRVPELMDKAAEIFEQDVELALVSFTQLIEPIMVAAMGGFVGFILIAIFIPLYTILGSF